MRSVQPNFRYLLQDQKSTPGEGDPAQYALAKRQMTSGSTLLALEVKGGKDAAFRMSDALSVILMALTVVVVLAIDRLRPIGSAEF